MLSTKINISLVWVLAAALTVTAATSCKNTLNSSISPEKVEELKKKVLDYLMNNQEGLPDDEIKSMRASAKSILDLRMKESPKSITSMDKDLWVYDAILKSSEVIFGATLKGGWIDFKENGNYTYGFFDGARGQGKYHYSSDTNLLLLLDNSNAMKPHEYQIKPNNDMIVMEGNGTYKDNNIQAKLSRSASAPTTPKDDTK